MRPFPAGMVELVDAPDSKSGARDGVGVQVPLPAPNSKRATLQRSPFCFLPLLRHRRSATPLSPCARHRIFPVVCAEADARADFHVIGCSKTQPCLSQYYCRVSDLLKALPLTGFRREVLHRSARWALQMAHLIGLRTLGNTPPFTAPPPDAAPWLRARWTTAGGTPCQSSS